MQTIESSSGQVMAFHYALYDEEPHRMPTREGSAPIGFLQDETHLPAACVGQPVGAYARHHPERRQVPPAGRIEGGGRRTFRAGELVRIPGAIGVVAASLVLSACVLNPVTGDKDLLLVSEAWELQVGAEQYAPLRQAQGGDYVVDPGVESYVRAVGQRLAAVSDRELPYEFNVINDSTPNAWALPGGKISINRGLLHELQTEAELAAVLGHEIVHAAAKHGARGQTRGLALQTAVITATVVGAREGYGQLAQLGSTVGAQLINSRYGREAEFESDRYGMEYMARAGYNPQGAVDLQRTFVRLSEGRRSDFLSGLFASHPPSPARVAANERTLADLGSDGSTGAERYARAMRRLARAEPAYRKFDEAQVAFEGGDERQAESLLREALSIEPGEGNFHALLGDIALASRDHGSARRHYDRAITLNDEWFYYYLQRANAYRAGNDLSAARADYERSIELLPNAPAQEALGQLALESGDVVLAKRYLAAAVQAGGDTGKRARRALLEIETPDGSAVDLLAVRTGVSRAGSFAIQLINESSRPIGDITLSVRAGNQRAQTRRIRGSLAAGASRILDTGQRLSRSRIGEIEVSVVRARLGR